MSQLFLKNVGIDLGTSNTLVYVKGKGIVIREPSVVAINKNLKTVMAVGEEAKKMIGRTPGNIVAIRPMEDGVIADFDITQNMIKYFIRKAYGRKTFFKPRVLICVPSGVTEVEKRAVTEAAEQAGARESYVIEEPMAAAIGAGLPIAEPEGSMVVDIGGGTSEVAVLSLGGIVTSKSIRIGGNEFDNAIIQYAKKEYNLMIGERTAEEIKINIGSVYKVQESEMNIKGRDLVSGLPKTVRITSEEVRRALQDSMDTILDAIRNTLEKTPPELASDIMEKGIMLTGGGALLNGLDQLIREETGIPVSIAENPLDCVVNGTGMALDNIEMFNKVITAAKRIS